MVYNRDLEFRPFSHKPCLSLRMAVDTQRTHMLRLLGPKNPLYKAFGAILMLSRGWGLGISPEKRIRSQLLDAVTVAAWLQYLKDGGFQEGGSMWVLQGIHLGFRRS